MQNLWEKSKDVAEKILWELEEYGGLRMQLEQFEWSERETLINKIAEIISNENQKSIQET